MRFPWQQQKPIPIERSSTNIIISDKQQQAPTPGGYATYTKMYKQHPIVRASVDKIAKTCVANGYVFRSRDSTVPVNMDHVKILAAIFERSKMQMLLRQAYADLEIYGDGYWFVTKSRLGVPYAFLRSTPSQTSVVIDRITRQPVSYIVRDSTGNQIQYQPTEMLHFKLFDPDNDVYGLSPLESLKSTVAQDLFAQSFNENFFANSAQTGLIFNMKDASPTEVERNKETLKKEYSGTANAHKPLILEGDITVQKSISTPADMQFIDGRRKLTEEILAVYDLPYTKLGGTSESANRSQSSENDKSFRAETITPLQSVIEEVINEDFILGILKIDDTVFAHKEVDFRDEEAVMKDHVEGLTHGIYTLDWVRNERGLAGYGPKGGGDVPYISTSKGILPVSMLTTLTAAESAGIAAPDPSAEPTNAIPSSPTGKP